MNKNAVITIKIFIYLVIILDTMLAVINSFNKDYPQAIYNMVWVIALLITVKEV